MSVNRTSLGKRISFYRSKSNLTQEALAAKVNCSREYIVPRYCHFLVNTFCSFIEFFIRTIPVFLHIENRLCHLLQIGNLDFLSVGIVLLGFYAILQINNQPKIRLDV